MSEQHQVHLREPDFLGVDWETSPIGGGSGNRVEFGVAGGLVAGRNLKRPGPTRPSSIATRSPR